MPSPIAHTTVAYALWRVFASRPLPANGSLPRIPPSLVAVAFLCLLPDLPSVQGLFTGQLTRYHNSWEHSLPVGFVVAAVCAVIALGLPGERPLRWFLIGLLCYESHVLMDSLTIGRGVMLLWPFADERLESPISIFYGLHWSDGWLSWRHLVTVATETVFGAVLIWATHRLVGHRRLVRS